jgi:hypothetical protein
MPVGVLGISFLTPTDGLFALAALVPLAAAAVTERRSGRIRALLGVRRPGLRGLVPVATALVLLPALVAVAAAQPVVVQPRLVRERGDAQAFFVVDTSGSMLAASAPGAPTRIDRARALARRLRAALPGVPVGLASLTDRTLPELMPTTDAALFDRTLVQSVGIDEPPPSDQYGHGVGTSLLALIPVATSNFYSTYARRRLLVVFTDGELMGTAKLFGIEMQSKLAPIFVHVWAPGERIYGPNGSADPYYRPDPRSGALLASAAEATGGAAFDEHQLGRIAAAAQRVVGSGPLTAQVDAYERIALAPWFALGGILPLGFLLYRRNL